LAYRASWRFTEKKPGRYDWSVIDASLAEAEGKGVPFALSVTAGIHTPSFVYDAGAERFEFQSSDMALVMPIPWDEVYLQFVTNFIAAVGARYGTRVSRMQFIGINSTTQETLLPADTGALADWQTVGYTNSRILQAFNEIGSKLVASFPSSLPIASMHGRNFLPSIPDNPDATMDLINAGVAAFPNFVLQYNGAVGIPSLLWEGVPTYLANYPGRTLGLQAGAPLGQAYIQGTLAQAESLGAAWLELYPPDLSLI
jgi:hypothetical protein